MTTYVVTTQTLENYGAHDGSGKFADGESYWKCKGGHDIIVQGLDRYQDAWAFVAAIAPASISWKEIPTQVQTYDEWKVALREAWTDKDAYDYFFKSAHERVVNPNDPKTVQTLGW